MANGGTYITYQSHRHGKLNKHLLPDKEIEEETTSLGEVAAELEVVPGHETRAEWVEEGEGEEDAEGEEGEGEDMDV